MSVKAILLTPLVFIMVCTGSCRTMIQSHSASKETQVVDRVARLTGLNAQFEVESVANISATAIPIPFLRKGLEGKSAIRVTFRSGTLKLKTAPMPRAFDLYSDRKFIAILTSDANHLISITSTVSKRNDDIYPEKPIAKTEAELLSHGERYESFPTSDPKISFLDALTTIHNRGFSAPYQSQQIDAFYLVHSGVDHAPRPEWIITLRGFPPYNVGADPGPAWTRNYMREEVDAEKGAWLGAGSYPVPAY